MIFGLWKDIDDKNTSSGNDEEKNVMSKTN